MDVLVLIDKLDDLVHNAKAVPLTDQVRIDREEIYDILDQMRATIPEEIKQARWIVKERQEMLAEAKREVDRLLAEAREQAVREASQTEIVKIAERQAGEIDERLGGLRAIAIAVPGEDEGAGRDPRAEREHLHGAVAGVDDEAGLDRGAEILGDEGAERAVVVCAEDHVQLGDAAGEEPLGLVGRAAPDQRQLRYLPERRSRLQLRKLRVGRDEQNVRVLQHLRPLERSFPQRQVGESQVELAVLEQAQEIRGGALLPHANADERPLGAEAAYE